MREIVLELAITVLYDNCLIYHKEGYTKRKEPAQGYSLYTGPFTISYIQSYSYCSELLIATGQMCIHLHVDN